MGPSLEDLMREIQNGRTEVADLRKQLTSEFEEFRATLKVIPELKEKIVALETENTTMKEELSRLGTQANMMDQQMKFRNLVMYGVPGSAREKRDTSEALVSKIFSKTGVNRRVVMAHRLGSRDNSPILIQFLCKSDAQEVFQKLRKNPDMSLQFLSLGTTGKVEIRYHLSTFLGDLLRAATTVKKDANWSYCRPITSTQTIEMVKTKDANSERITIKSMDDLIRFRDALMDQGEIQPNSPAAAINSTETCTRKRLRPVRANSTNKQVRKDN